MSGKEVFCHVKMHCYGIMHVDENYYYIQMYNPSSIKTFLPLVS